MIKNYFLFLFLLVLVLLFSKKVFFSISKSHTKMLCKIVNTQFNQGIQSGYRNLYDVRFTKKPFFIQKNSHSHSSIILESFLALLMPNGIILFGGFSSGCNFFRA